MSTGYQLVKRSLLPPQSMRGATGVYSVRYGVASGRLHFSKALSLEMFGDRHLLLIEFDGASDMMRFRAYGQDLPAGIEEADLFRLLRSTNTEKKFIESAIAAKKLLRFLEIDPAPGVWPILDMHPDRHTVAVKVARKAVRAPRNEAEPQESAA